MTVVAEGLTEGFARLQKGETLKSTPSERIIKVAENARGFLQRVFESSEIPTMGITTEPITHVIHMKPRSAPIHDMVHVELYDQDDPKHLDISQVTIQLDGPRVIVPINHSQGTEYPTAASFIQGMAANDR